jgi:hypothetical protein
VGAALFAYVLYHTGLDALYANLRRAGWILLPVGLLWIPIFLCRTAAWQLTMGGSPGPTPPLWRTFVIAITTFGLNIITPFVQAGGEVLRAKAVTPWLGAQRATGSTVTYYMLHALSNLALWLSGLTAALLFVPLPTPYVLTFALLATLILAAFVFVMSRHQHGIVAPLVRLLRLVPLVGRRLAAPLEAGQTYIDELDAVVVGFYRHSPGRFWIALAIDTLGRVIAMGEYWLVARGVGLELTFLQTFVIGALNALIVNVIFFVPLEAGVKEGGFYLVFQLLGLDPALGVFAAIVQRLREFLWVAIGLSLIPLAGGRETGEE